MINIAYQIPTSECQWIGCTNERANERQRKDKGLLFIAFIQFNLCSANKTEWTLCTTRSKSRRQSVCRREYTDIEYAARANIKWFGAHRTDEWHTFTIFISIFIGFVDEDAKIGRNWHLLMPLKWIQLSRRRHSVLPSAFRCDWFQF